MRHYSTGTYWLAAGMLLVAVLGLARLAPALIGLLPLADRQNVVMQSSALNLPETTAAMLGHVQFALFGVAGILVVLALDANRGGRLARLLLENPALPMSALLLALTVAYAFERSIIIEGTRVFYLDDDAMITMRYARNLARGFGPVWNSGEQVEGYTNFLWMLVMAGVHLVGLPETTTSLAVMLVIWGLVTGTLLLLQDTLKALHVGRLWIYLACLSFALDINIVHWASSGLESLLLALLVMICAWALVRNKERSFLFSLALIPLARADAAILAVAFGLIYWWRQRSAHAVRLLVLAALPALAHEVFRLAYYGDWLPNTYYLKMTGIENRWLIGVSYALRLLHLYPLGLIALGAAALLEPRLRFAAWVCAVQILYMIYAGGDTFWLLRPFVSVLPLVYLAVGVTLNHLADARSRPAWVGVWLLAAPAAAWGGVLFANPQQERSLLGAQVQVMAYMIEANVPTTALISLEPAGSIPYFAQDHRFLDALGKSDAYIAHLPAHPGNTLIGHNKFDWDYVYQTRQPDIVLASCVLPDIWIPLPPDFQPTVYDEAGVNGLSYLPYQLLHPDFVSLYYPNRVYYLTPSPDDDWIICPFARAGSGLQRAWILSDDVKDSLSLEFDQSVEGAGWHPPDVWEDGRTVQWTGPQVSSELYLPFAPSAPYTIEMCAIPIRDQLLNSLQIRANDMPLELQEQATSACDGVHLTASGERDEQNFLTLEIQVGATIIPDSITGNGDTRQVGIAFDWLRVNYR
jgi:hypothetical protein